MCPSTAWVTIVLGRGRSLIWNIDDQKGAFNVWQVPEPWYKFFCIGKSVPGYLLGRPDLDYAYPAMTAIPMGWLLAVATFQDIHRRLGYLEEPVDAGLPVSLGWAQNAPTPIEGLQVDCPKNVEAEWWQVYVDDLDAPVIVLTADIEKFLGVVGSAQRGNEEGL